MCGIVGMFDMRGGREIDRAMLHRMNETQFHRGPVEGGLHLEPGLGFGHRRLSIIDLESGQQPLFNEDHSVVVVFNGEIYNFQALMAQLTELGHTFRTHSDTEVIVHAWEQWGEQCVQHLRGMFGFTIWDRNQQTLFMARDRLGIKPMHYAFLPDGMLVFGSELKSVLCFPNLPREIDPRAVEDYFAYGYVPEPRTIFKHALKLSPGHTLTLKVGQPAPEPKKYWDVPFTAHPPMAEEEMEQELIVRLREAVSSHMIADVPLGAFLSGGVDSSAIVAMMAGLTQEPVNTCSIAFNDKAFDESEYASQVAARYNTDHHKETVESDDYGLIDTLAGLYDEPYADSSAIPTYRVCELARKRVTVALSGDGGDENFAGYRRHRFAMGEEKVRSMLPLTVRKPLFGFLGKAYPKADWAPRMFRAKTTFEALARDLVEGYFHGVSIQADRVRDQLFSDQFRTRLQGYRAIEVMRGHAKNAPTDDPLSIIQYIDMKTYLPGDILTKVDRASMAHALEVRVPLLDHQFVEWVSGLPSSSKLRNGEGKHIFKKALKPYLSDDILYRKKMGFSIPLGAWLRGPLRESMRKAVLNPALLDTGIFNETYLKTMIEEHQSGSRDHTVSLWSVLMFEAFLRKNGAAEAAGEPLMRILHVLDHSIPLHSGYTFRTRSILREQQALGWETFHLTGSKQGATAALEEDVDGLHFYRTPKKDGFLSKLPVLNQIEVIDGLARRLEQIIPQIKPDVLHAHSPSLNAIAALRAGKKFGIPVVYEVRAFWEDAAVDHGTASENGLRYKLTRALETHALKNANAVTTICEGLRKDIVARGIAADKVTVIPNAVDIDKFAVGGVADQELKRKLGLQDMRLIGFIGSFYAYEGLDVLLRAVPAMLAKAPDMRVLLVGGGPQDAQLRQLAKDLKIEDKVVFTGRVPHEQVAQYYDLLDVLVYPRMSMRLTDLVTPLKPLEAMAQGRVLAASDVGGHLELIEHGKTGVLFKADDPHSLAEHVGALLAAQEQWPALRANGRTFVETERNWPISVARYKAIYARLTGLPAAGTPGR